MNNTTTKRNLALAAVFIAATLLVGTVAVATTIATREQSTAFAYSQKNKGDDNSRNGNTVTIEDCKNKGSASGFDTTTNQECENLICTHPGENATCVSEGRAAVTPKPTPTPTPKTCEECFTTILSQAQLTSFIKFTGTSLADWCSLLEQGKVSELGLRVRLADPAVGVDIDTQDELIACLKAVGIVFPLRE